jgi:hypothetical protein
MATLEQEANTRNQLKNLLAEVSSIQAGDLVRSAELGPGLNFENGVIFFSRTLRLLHSLDDANLEDVPYQKLEPLRAQVQQARDVFNEVKDFNLTKFPNNPIAQRDSIVNRVRDQYDQLFESAAPIIAYTIRKGTDFAKLEEQGRAALSRIDSFAEEQKKALEAARASAEQLLEDVRRFAREAGVSQHAIHFKEEADQNQQDAGKWLIATVWLGVSTLAVGLGFVFIYFRTLTTWSPTQNLQISISKIIIFSVLLTATLWAGKTYRALRHNAIVNRHRQNALTTFQTFAEAAIDPATKDAILLQSTQCIFSPQQTGYISGDPEGGIPQVLEIVRNLGKTG